MSSLCLPTVVAKAYCRSQPTCWWQLCPAALAATTESRLWREALQCCYSSPGCTAPAGGSCAVLLHQPWPGSRQVPMAGLWQGCWCSPDGVQLPVAGVLCCCSSPDAMQRLMGGMWSCCRSPDIEAGHHGDGSGVHPCPSLPGCWDAGHVQLRPAWLPTSAHSSRGSRKSTQHGTCPSGIQGPGDT